jgi:hypothetical protein
VCDGLQSWASAAALATVRVACRLESAAIPAFQDWLQLHADQLLTLEVTIKYFSPRDGPQHSLQLPLNKFTKLQELCLEGFKLQLPGEDLMQHSSSTEDCSRDRSAGQEGAAACGMLASLQHLTLQHVQLICSSSLQQLAKAPLITSITLRYVSFNACELGSKSSGRGHRRPRPRTQEAKQQVADAMPSLLQQLPQLSELHLSGILVTDAAIQQTAAMLGLQRLSFTDR